MSPVTANVDDLHVTTGSPGTLALRGVLSFATATQALQAMRAAMTASAPGTLDLSGLSHGDSAGLACLLAITAEASAAGHPLQLTHLPEGMRALAGVCGVDQLLA